MIQEAALGSEASLTVGAQGKLLTIAITDQDGATTSPSTSLDIAPTITHHEAAGKIHAKLLPGAQYHAGFRLAAVALFLVVVLANLDRVERQNGGKLRIDLIDVGAVRFAARDIRLIGDDDQQKAFALQFFERRAGAACDDEAHSGHAAGRACRRG